MKFTEWFERFKAAAAAGDVPDYRVTRQIARLYYSEGFSFPAAVFNEQQRSQRLYKVAATLGMSA